MITTGVLALLFIVTALSSGGGDDAVSPSADRTPGTTKTQGGGGGAPAGDEPTAKLPLQDGDWRLDTVTVSNSLGDFSGRARVTYTGDDSNGGTNIFSITLFVGGKDVGVLQGSASDVRPNGTVTVDLFSTDKYVKGPYKYDFQNNL